jgi:hypothetical protein
MSFIVQGFVHFHVGIYDVQLKQLTAAVRFVLHDSSRSLVVSPTYVILDTNHVFCEGS